ncbi:MAG TPA: hypothetical protein VJZ76_05225 [Thermoanaerobaculia bacterium]|nr:hypothetical protein [Thermoanaerobaculia bacterium]
MLKPRWLGHHALLVPSVRRQNGINLVVLEPDPAHLSLEIISAEAIAENN